MSAHIGVRFIWAGSGVAAASALVGLFLAARMENLVTDAVVEHRMSPSTGEAGEQALLLALICFTIAVLAVASLVVGVVLRIRLHAGRRDAGGIAIGTAVVAVWVDALLFALVWTFADQRTHDLFGYWYFPFLAVMAATCTGCLTGAAVVLNRRPIRNQNHSAQPPHAGVT